MPDQAAQARAERIRAFREELEQLRSEGVLELSPEQRSALDAHHDATLRDLAARFDVDLSAREKQLSWGMRITSLLAAIALGAAVYFLFFRVWGLLTTPVQVLVLVASPLLGILGTEIAGRRDRTGYFTGLFGVVTFTCFVINVVVLGAIANLAATPLSFLAYGAFALVLAYAHGLRVLLWLGLLGVLAWIATMTGSLDGCCWFDSLRRPENFIVAGALLFGASAFVRHAPGSGFATAYRVLGLASVFVPVVILANWGDPSYLPFDPGAIEILYQCLGFALAGLAAWLGARSLWRETANLGVGFFVLLLYTKMFSWWWDALPKYLFFLVLGVVGVVLLLLLRRFRAATKEAAR